MSGIKHLPWPPEPTDPAALADVVIVHADRVASTIRIARAFTGAHRTVDLAGLDDLVGQLCARALDLPPALGRTLHFRLAEIDRDLAALAVALVPPA